ncbi:DNA repair protein rad2, partial [Coemansia sp. RSA 2599]
EPVSSLHAVLWKINRRLEKQPDLDQETVSAVSDERTAAMWAKISCLTLMSNYLGFVLRWRQMRDRPPDQDTNERGICIEESLEDVRNGHNQDESKILADETQSLASGIHHDTIFQKSRFLAEQEDAKMPLARKQQTGTVCEPKGPRNLDSDSDGGFSDESDDDDNDFVEVGPAQHAAMELDVPADRTLSRPKEDNGLDDDDEDAGMDLTAAEQEELLRSEQDEYALFVRKLQGANDDLAASNTNSFETMRSELQSELLSLRAQVRDSARDASGVGADMVEDIRMLLTLFGIPYITAPMEAEAQCAALINAGLVDGMVTDDSDAFLFAAAENTTVYRHFFQKDKFVEMYSSRNIYRDSSLTQRDFVFLAYLLGSDYTVGIKGIGPVLGMEALAEFGPGSDQSKTFESDEESIVDALRSFGEWCRAVIDVLPGMEIPRELAGTAQRRRLAQVVRKATIPEKFPDPRVVRAYLHPQVDDADAKFTWGFPKLDLLRQFLGEKLGWSVEKTNEMLVPLVRKMSEEKTGAASAGRQLTLDAYAVANANAATQHSKRIGKAISSHKRHAAKDPSEPKKTSSSSAKVSHHPLI